MARVQKWPCVGLKVAHKSHATCYSKHASVLYVSAYSPRYYGFVDHLIDLYHLSPSSMPQEAIIIINNSNSHFLFFCPLQNVGPLCLYLVHCADDHFFGLAGILLRATFPLPPCKR